MIFRDVDFSSLLESQDILLLDHILNMLLCTKHRTDRQTCRILADQMFNKCRTIQDKDLATDPLRKPPSPDRCTGISCLAEQFR